MRFVLIGAPGAGKGTQAEKLSKALKIPRITTGDLFRQAVEEKSPLGEKVKDILEQGALVSDDIVLALMQERMSKPDALGGFILDGFPRTMGQAEGLEKWLEKKEWRLDGVIALEVADKEVVARISGRRQCTQCGVVYHVTANKPSQENICDACGGRLIQRKDDAEATVRHRLNVYKKETAPLLSYYEKRGLLQTVDGSQSVEKIFASIRSLIK